MTVIMAAPNGGRRTRADHPALPITITECVECGVACEEAGADAIHVHLRDADGGHLLDAGGYREMIAGLRAATPGLAVQITTESIGRYGPVDQMAVVRDTRPDFASCALRELLEDEPAALRFYAEMAEAGVGIQHILYTEADIARLRALRAEDRLRGDLSVILVIGSYPDGGGTAPDTLARYLAALDGAAGAWMVCGFGAHETRLAAAAMALGGHARVGFENALVMADGRAAPDMAARVAEVAALRSGLGLGPSDAARALGRFGG